MILSPLSLCPLGKGVGWKKQKSEQFFLWLLLPVPCPCNQGLGHAALPSLPLLAFQLVLHPPPGDVPEVLCATSDCHGLGTLSVSKAAFCWQRQQDWEQSWSLTKPWPELGPAECSLLATPCWAPTLTFSSFSLLDIALFSYYGHLYSADCHGSCKTVLKVFHHRQDSTQRAEIKKEISDWA